MMEDEGIGTTTGRQGDLRVFLGAAPGVGKTYAMLREGHRLREEGVDVVIGLVETHGRAETERQIGDLEIIPRRRLEYSGVALEEMDVDAILRRHPDIVLIDELAHSNAPGSARPKRWQDVDVLRRAGIDVLGTMNIQHIAELGDVVSGITGTEVKETVPDEFLDSATDLQLIDLPVELLEERMRQGKIYPPETAALASRHFFQAGNLTALRELALRRAAAGIDERLAAFMIEDERAPLEASDRVAVLINASKGWPDLARQAWRISRSLHAPLRAVYVPESLAASSSAPYRLLAEDLGMDVDVVVPEEEGAASRCDALCDYLRTNRITMLVLPARIVPGGFLRASRVAGIGDVECVLRQMPHLMVQIARVDAEDS